MKMQFSGSLAATTQDRVMHVDQEEVSTVPALIVRATLSGRGKLFLVCTDGVNSSSSRDLITM